MPYLDQYIKQHPEVLDRVSEPGLFLSAVSEVDLAGTLFRFGLLPENYRAKFVETVMQYAVDGRDCYVFESKALRKTFTPEEDNRLLARVREELVPKLSEVRDELEDEYPADEDPESYIQPFLDVLAALKREFLDDKAVTEVVDEETKQANRWAQYVMEDHRERGDEGEYEEPEYYSGQARDDHSSGRSIFEDVDA